MRAAAVAVVLVSATAFAQAPGEVEPAPPAPATPAPATPAKPTAPTGLEAAQEWAASNHGLFGSTALTVPAGHVEITGAVAVPAAAIGEINAGLTSSTEVWADAAGVIDISDDGDGAKTYGAGIKQIVARSKQAAIAITGAVRRIPDDENRGYKSVGLVATLCGDPACGVMLSGAIQHLFGADFGHGDTGATAVTLSASVGKPNVRLLVDLVALDSGSLAFAGIRLGNRTVAADLAVVRELDNDYAETIPYLSLSVRL